MRILTLTPRLGWLAPVFLLACTGGSDTDPATDLPDPLCTDARDLACADPMLIDLNLLDLVSTGEVSNEAAGNDWITQVDATAGGFANAAQNPWIYVRFTDTGAERVDITDTDALDSLEWHVAAHRYKLRINGGTGGPSCVAAAAFLDASYDELGVSDLDGANFQADAFYTSECELVQDSGLGDPQFAMGAWWTYPSNGGAGCVATSGIPFLLQLESGRTLKLEVIQYYGEGQEACNTTGAIGSDSGRLAFKWSFVN